MINQKLRNQIARNFVRKQDRVLRDEMEISSERGQRIIMRDFLLLQSKLNCQLSEDFYRLYGRYSTVWVGRLFGSFGSAVLVYQKSLRSCLKCSTFILKPDWLCDTCRLSNAEIEDYS